MAGTDEGRALTQRHRAAQVGVRSAAVRDMRELWRTVDPAALALTIAPFAEASAVVVTARHRQSAEVSSRYVEALRRVEGAAGAVAIVAGEPPTREVSAGVVRGAALAGILRARRAGFSLDAAARAGFVRASGSLSSLVLAGGRQVLGAAVRSDRQAVGWMRVTGPQPCDWCAMLASRGPVYKSQRTAAFDSPPDQYHDHDACTIEPVYREDARDDRSQWPETSRRLRERWDEVTGGLSGAEARRAFRRALAESRSP